MRYALIDGETVVNIIEAEDGSEFSDIEGYEVVPDPSNVAYIGGAYVNGNFVPYEEPPLPPGDTDATSMTRAQLLIGLLRKSFITQYEAENDPAVLPVFLDNAYSALPPDERAEAIIQWKNRTEFAKSDPIFTFTLPAVAQSMGFEFNAEDLTAFFNEFSRI